MKIFNYKLFLENMNTDDESENEEEFRKGIDRLKKALIEDFEPVLIIEKSLRQVGNKQKIEEGADYVINTLKEVFTKSALNNPNISEELKETLIPRFQQALDDSRNIFIENSYTAGIDKSVNFFIEFMEEIKNEGEEWKQPKDIDYSKLTQDELANEIIDAHAEGDMEKVNLLRQYLNESLQLSDIHMDKLEQTMDELVDLIANFYPVL